MILYPKDQKEAVIRKIRTLLSDPNTPRGAFSQLAKEEQIPKATIYLWKKEVEADLISQDPVKGTPTHTWSSEAKFQAVLATAAMNELQLGQYLRSNGILKQELDNWRITCSKANDRSGETTSKYRSELASEKAKSKKLEAELNRKEKALAETAALLVLRGKVQAIWGDKGVE